MVLEIKNFEKQNKDEMIFGQFSLEIPRGEAVSIYSSTTVRDLLLMTLIGKAPISQGYISVNGVDVSRFNRKYNAQIGVVFLSDGIYERLSIVDHFKFYKGLYQSSLSIDTVMKIVQLGARKRDKVQNLSYSEKRRIQMARVIFHDPSVFVFEEPEQNVDIETKRILIKIIQTLKEQHKSILILTGNTESAIMLADHAYRLNRNGLQLIEVEPEQAERLSEEEQDKEEAMDESPVTSSYQFEKIPTKIDKKIVLFDPTEINYIESSSGEVNLHVRGEVFQGLLTLTEFEEKLEKFGFFRCHRSYLVNLQKVKEVITWTRNSYSLILDDRSEIPLSKTKMVTLKELIGIN